MLSIDIPEIEIYDREKQEFQIIKPQHLILEHSLISISKWEAKWKKSFLSSTDKTVEMMYDYIRCMTVNKNVDDRIYSYLSQDTTQKISEYIENSMTATTFSSDRKLPMHIPVKYQKNKIITSEEIYYQMFSLQIPIECEKWHLNRLLTLLRIFNVKNNPKKMSKAEIMRQNTAINNARRAKYHSRG